MRVGVVVRAEPFPEARKPAYKLWIDLGALGEKRSSAQVTDHYRPDELLGPAGRVRGELPAEADRAVRLGGAGPGSVRERPRGDPAAAGSRGRAWKPHRLSATRSPAPASPAPRRHREVSRPPECDARRVRLRAAAGMHRPGAGGAAGRRAAAGPRPGDRRPLRDGRCGTCPASCAPATAWWSTTPAWSPPASSGASKRADGPPRCCCCARRRGASGRRWSVPPASVRSARRCSSPTGRRGRW